MAEFTSTTEIRKLLGRDGYDDALADLSSSEGSSFIDDAIEYATKEITTYTQEYYSDDDIEDDNQIRVKATFIACHYLSQRRGNASLYEGMIEQIYQWLEQIRSYKLHLPGKQVFTPDVPIVRNHVINFRSRNRIQVDGPSSTGTHADEVISPGDEFHYP